MSEFNKNLLAKLKQVIDNCDDPNAESINIKLDYSELVHLYSLEKGNVIYQNTLEEQLQNSFDKMEKLL